MTKLTLKLILAKKDDPDGLENLYRSDPEAFKAALLSAFVLKPDSKLFKYWRVRLEYKGVDNCFN
mgnify:FL=1